MKSMRRKKTNMIRLMRIPLVECRLIGLQIAALAALYVLCQALPGIRRIFLFPVYLRRATLLFLAVLIVFELIGRHQANALRDRIRLKQMQNPHGSINEETFEPVDSSGSFFCSPHWLVYRRNGKVQLWHRDEIAQAMAYQENDAAPVSHKKLVLQIKGSQKPLFLKYDGIEKEETARTIDRWLAEPEAPAVQRVCPSCGTVNRAEDRFCSACGASLLEKHAAELIRPWYLLALIGALIVVIVIAL
ncbi:MAG TPA: zinc ribbon domain-containing protein [Erysipelotrichaceae bacterium]|nr:zinc ribbon domain-containing protein [Erysipelotrichaceae bacterium]HCW55518.1 zinc ribbon domain-containing protein [Erysipelotrichaceae bacterium]